MEQLIRFCKTADGMCIANAVAGEGSPVVFPPPWVSHLELEWQEPKFRAFAEALARRHTVVRYDRVGCGLSDRSRYDFTLETDVHALEAVVDRLGLGKVALFGASMAGPVILEYALRHPRRVSQLFLYGSWARAQSGKLPQALAALIRAHWGVGSQTMADIFLPGADAEATKWYAKFQRESAAPEMAAQLLLGGLLFEPSQKALQIKTPTLVLHRKGDKVTAFERGRELAALMPAAQFVPLEGEIHRFYFDDPNAVLDQIGGALGDPPGSLRVGQEALENGAAPDGFAPLTPREVQVLRLIASGQANKEIARALGLQVPTVERHAVNLYRKIGARSRAEAALAAVRMGVLQVSRQA